MDGNKPRLFHRMDFLRVWRCGARLFRDKEYFEVLRKTILHGHENLLSGAISGALVGNEISKSLILLVGAGAVRIEMAKDPGWQEFLKSSSGLVAEMYSTVMLPAPHSPLK